MKKPKQKHYIENDVLLVHKPVGITSFGLVAKMRKILGTRKIGHAGTLDPLASGLMILGINKGTKKLNKYIKKDKIYLADVIIGVSTTTGDREGEIVEEKIVYKGDITEFMIESVLKKLEGEHYYPAPLYSAVKVLGKPLYSYARRGEKPPFIPEKKMHLIKSQILDMYKSGDRYIVRIRARVGSGTYIRTLAEELGKKIGYPASLKSLYRISIGDFSDHNSYYIDKKNNHKKSLYAIIRNILDKNKKKR